MENSQWQPVLSYKHMQRLITPFKGVIINVTILHGVRSHSRHLLTGRKETQLAPGEQVAFNTKILDWMGEGGGRTVGKGQSLRRG